MARALDGGDAPAEGSRVNSFPSQDGTYTASESATQWTSDRAASEQAAPPLRDSLGFQDLPRRLVATYIEALVLYR
jgi:hypothetical protein